MNRQQLIEELAQRIVKIERPHPIRVAIDGVDGAGKTTLADELVAPLQAVDRPVVRASIDGFHNPARERHIPMGNHESFIFSDLSLARRLEKTEGRSNVEFVEARARACPQSNAEWIEVAGTYAMFDGVTSPLTQTFGLGVFEPLTAADMDRLEAFFQLRGAPVFHEVSPLADNTTLALLTERGYQPVEFTSVMFRPIRRGIHFTELRNENIAVRVVSEGEHDLWARTAAQGWSEFAELADFMLELGKVSAMKSTGLSFIAELNGQPIATGAMSICEGVALLAGASTIPEGRKQGAQLALLDTRLRAAAEQGCDIAMMGALPGSASQRNAERQGFRIAYTRIKWQLPCGM